MSTPAPAVPLSPLAEQMATLLALVVEHTARPPRPKLYDYGEAAAELRIEESWLRDHIRELPHSKFGGRVWFTDADLARIPSLFHHEPGDAAPRAPTRQPDAPATRYDTSQQPTLSQLKPRGTRRARAAPAHSA